MAYVRKTRDEWQLHGDYGQGFEEITAEETYDGIRERLREYRQSEPRVPFKVRYVRVKIEQGKQVDAQAVRS